MKIKLFVIIMLLNVFALHAQDCKLTPEAQRYFDRGMAAMESVKAEDDWHDVVTEFEKALQHAPNCADIYFNLGLAYQKAGELRGTVYFDKAEESFKKFLELNPKASDDDKKFVQKQLNGIEYKKEKYRKDAMKAYAEQEKEEEIKEKEAFVGCWKGSADSRSCNLEINLVNGTLYLTSLIFDIDGTDPIVIEYKSGILSFEVPCIYYDNEGEYNAATKADTGDLYSNIKTFDTRSTEKFQIRVRTDGKLDVKGSSTNVRNYRKRSNQFIGYGSDYTFNWVLSKY